jgi:aspartyl-tRNA(Asn)/glutamyl-tRNA(Gln) amidotransferase subunit C
MTNEEIKKLGFLARIDVSDAEADQLGEDMKTILGYIGEISSLDIDDVEPVYENVNTMRSDETVLEAGSYSDDILKNAPNVQDGFIKVKKIL